MFDGKSRSLLVNSLQVSPMNTGHPGATHRSSRFCRLEAKKWFRSWAWRGQSCARAYGYVFHGESTWLFYGFLWYIIYIVLFSLLSCFSCGLWPRWPASHRFRDFFPMLKYRRGCEVTNMAANWDVCYQQLQTSLIKSPICGFKDQSSDLFIGYDMDSA
jgi:hypothetical protein